MYLHIGRGSVVREKDIVGLFDLDKTTTTKTTRETLSAAEKSGQVINVTDELPKTFALCAETKIRRSGFNPIGKQFSQTIYISQLSTQTLVKRLKNGFTAEF
ncbi:MAG: DUF370 domain-containing protein [Oscillospiraceae bacterium]|jgi:hypothetical protein|nr:DUF370 domain-containing protein [Oscillospiraceae bacterium]